MKRTWEELVRTRINIERDYIRSLEEYELASADMDAHFDVANAMEKCLKEHGEGWWDFSTFCLKVLQELKNQQELRLLFWNWINPIMQEVF